MQRSYFNVRPRYTPGSPAQVSEAIALRVAEEERVSREHALSGAYGAEHRARAESLGLGPQPDRDGVRRGLAEEVVEHRDHWLVRDLPTGELYARPFSTSNDRRPPKPLRRCERCLAARERAQVVQ